MRKLITAACALVITAALVLPVSAEIDLSALTWEELTALKAQITMEQLSRGEWQEVEVPQGIYKVGEDIPAGKWTIRCTKGRSTHIYVGDALEKQGTAVDLTGSTDGLWVFVYSADKENDGKNQAFDIDLTEGQYIQIDHCSATFTPFAGKPDLGFKFK